MAVTFNSIREPGKSLEQKQSSRKTDSLEVLRSPPPPHPPHTAAARCKRNHEGLVGVSHSCCGRSNIRSASIRCAFPQEKKKHTDRSRGWCTAHSLSRAVTIKTSSHQRVTSICLSFSLWFDCDVTKIGCCKILFLRSLLASAEQSSCTSAFY